MAVGLDVVAACWRSSLHLPRSAVLHKTAEPPRRRNLGSYLDRLDQLGSILGGWRATLT